MDAAYPAHGNAMVIMTVGTFLMNSDVFIQLQPLLPPNPGPVLFSADLGNTNATMATVFTSGMCVMVLMTVEITQMNGFVLHPPHPPQPQEQILPHHP